MVARFPCPLPIIIGFPFVLGKNKSEESWSRSEGYLVGESVREILDSLTYYESVESISIEPNLLVIGADSEEYEEKFWSDTRKNENKIFLTLQNENEEISAKIYNSIAAKQPVQDSRQ